MKSAVERVRALLQARFGGQVSPLPYDVFRIGLASLVLVRCSDLLRPVLDLDHHAWVHGLEYHPAVEGVVEPALSSPLLPGLALGPSLALGFVWLRTLLTGSLLLGLCTRLSAAALALAGGALLAADRYRYLHHLQLLWLSVGWLAVAPGPTRFEIERWFRRRPVPEWLPRWPLQLLRLQCCAVYLAAGLAKLDAAWLSGKTLRELGELGIVGGPAWQRAVELCGFAGTASAVAVTELAIPLLLFIRRARPFAIAAGIVFHLAISHSMMVATFSPQMLLYLLLFLPFRERRER